MQVLTACIFASNGSCGSTTLPSGAAWSISMAVKDIIAEKLIKAFAPHSLEVEDESHRHVGHAGYRPGGSHFRIAIVAEAFRGKSRIERHRMVNAVLAAELAGGVHALAIVARAPEEKEA